MNRFTINIPEDLKKRIDLMPDVNWSQIAKNGILRQIKSLEKFERLKNKGDL